MEDNQMEVISTQIVVPQMLLFTVKKKDQND
jgi:hypothetical protein